MERSWDERDGFTRAWSPHIKPGLEYNTLYFFCSISISIKIIGLTDSKIIFFFSVRTGALYEMQSKCVPYITSSIQYLFRFFVFLFFFIPSLICGVMTKTRVGDQTSHFLCSLPRLVWSVHRAVTLEHSLTGNGGFTCLVGLVDEVCFLYEGIGL